MVEKKSHDEKLVDVSVGLTEKNENLLFIDGKKKTLKGFEHFSTDEIVAVKSFEVDGLQKEKKSVPLHKIEDKASQRFQQRITDGALMELIKSINERGLLTPLSVTLSEDEEGSYTLLDGFTRVRAIEALRDPNKTLIKELGISSLEIRKEWGLDSNVDVLVYTKEDGTRIDEEDCYKIANMSNTLRAKWNLLDIANAFKMTLRRFIMVKIGERLQSNPQLEGHVNTLFENGTPLIIINGLLHANILKAKEIAVIQEKVFLELEKDTGLNRNDLKTYARIAEIPSQFYPVITGAKNQWGVVISPKNAIDLFMGNSGQCRSAENIKRILNQLSLKVNPNKKGNAKVSKTHTNELKDALTEEEDSKARKITAAERAVALMLIEYFAKSGKILLAELPGLLEAYQNATSLEDFQITFKNKTSIELPKVDKFMPDRGM